MRIDLLGSCLDLVREFLGNLRRTNLTAVAVVFCVIIEVLVLSDDFNYRESLDTLFVGINRTGEFPSYNALFHKVMGDADSYLDPKKLPGRKKWSEESHLEKYKNDWIVDIIEGGKNDNFVLGYDYHNCGICNLCRDEGCFELMSSPI